MDTIGTLLQVTIFGESHGEGLGCVVSGLPAGMKIDQEALLHFMARRAPGQGIHSTQRRESDLPQALSGVSKQGITTGAPIAMVIANKDARSSDYADMPARPSHADYPAYVKYGGHATREGGGRFSGRLTAALCAAGGLCLQALKAQGISVGARLTRVGKVQGKRFDPLDPVLAILPDFPAASREEANAFLREIEAARMEGDSVGGIVSCAVTGMRAGIGEPFFDSVEARLSRLLFSIPAVKGVQFGDGFSLSEGRASHTNDAMQVQQGQVRHLTNHMGGIDGGITNGASLLFDVAFKPTATIGRAQQTVRLPPQEDATLVAKGRHDPCIAPRAVPVVEAVTAIGLLDLLLIGRTQHHG